MREYGLETELGKQSTYDSKLDPTLWNEFGTFAYRSGDSGDWHGSSGYFLAGLDIVWLERNSHE